MAVDKPKLDPGILELLYPDEVGELDEAEVRALRDEAELASHNARDLKAFDAMLGRIRAEEPRVEVRASVHDAIMAAARAHRENAASALTPTPVPEADRPPKQIAPTPIWARISMNTARQFALAASVLLVAGVFFVMMRPSPEMKFTSANSTVTADVTFGDSPPNPTAASPAQVAKAESLAPALMTEVQDIDDLEQEKSAEVAETKQAPVELALNTGADSATRSGAPQPEGMASSRYGGRAAPAPRSSRSAPSLGESRDERQEAARARRARASTKAKASKKVSKSAGVIDLWGKDGAPAPARPPMAESVADADELAPQAPKDTYKMDAIAESFASAHYDETIARADVLMRDASVPDPDKALALDFKARAQEASGDPSSALDTYQLLQQRYPTFRPGVIAAHIRRLDQQMINKPMRRERAAPMNSVDTMKLDSVADE